MIVVSENEMKAINFSSDFHKYAAAQGIRDPFRVQQEIFARRIKRHEDGTMTVELGGEEEFGNPSRTEKDTWIRMRDEYVARRCFEEIGYESFYVRTTPDRCYDISYMRTQDEFVPCKSADRQCSMECHRYIECALRGEWKPD